MSVEGEWKFDWSEIYPAVLGGLPSMEGREDIARNVALSVEVHLNRPAPGDALSVLRDLVAIEDTPLDKLHVGRVNDAWARARSLVAEHTTDEETT